MSTVLMAGGGTAGHVNPLLATAERLRQQGDDCLILGTREGLEAELVPAAGFELIPLARLPFPRRLTWNALLFPARFIRQVRTIISIIKSRGVDAVVGFGGYVAAPAYLAARLASIPLVVHEANALPGFANRLGARLTKNIATTFRHTKLAHANQTGLPLRAEFEVGVQGRDKQQTRVELGLDPVQPTLLVMGGSLGARSINEATIQALPLLRAAGVQVYHILGARSDLPMVNDRGYISVRYTNDMISLLVAADFAVARAGAATVCEFAAAGLPAMFVPYPVGNGEQRFNAADLVQAEAAVIVEDRELSPETFRSIVIPAISNRRSLEKMAEAARAEGILDATDRLVAMIRLAIASLGDK